MVVQDKEPWESLAARLGCFGLAVPGGCGFPLSGKAARPQLRAYAHGRGRLGQSAAPDNTGCLPTTICPPCSPSVN